VRLAWFPPETLAQVWRCFAGRLEFEDIAPDE